MFAQFHCNLVKSGRRAAKFPAFYPLAALSASRTSALLLLTHTLPPTPPTVISSLYRSEAYQRLLPCPHSLHLSFKDHSNEVQTCVNIQFRLINSPDCFTCLFSWYGLLIMAGGVGCVSCDFSQTIFFVCGTWICRLLPALHAHLPCTTLLNSEECALLEKKKKKNSICKFILRRGSKLLLG